MFKDREFFSHLIPTSGQVILGDGKTSLQIKGVGTVKCRIGSNILLIDNVRWVPELSESIYSLFLHIQSLDHSIKSTCDEGLIISFPTFQTKAVIGKNDIYLNANPCTESIDDSNISRVHVSSDNSVCKHLTQFQTEVATESQKVDNILLLLRRYYNEVKTKRQLNLEVPAGFRQSNQWQTDSRHHALLLKSSSINSDKDISIEETIPTILPSTIDLLVDNTSTIPQPLDSNTNSTPHSGLIPIIRSVDKSSSSLPNVITMNEDYLRASVGFRRVATMKKHLSTLYQKTVQLDHTPADAVLDCENFATMRKTKRNTTPVPRSLYFGETIHMDIVFGPEGAVGNIHYSLLFTDRFSRMNYLYPLQNLQADIPKQLNAFFAHIGFFPRRLITDFDLKLIGGKARDHLNSLPIHVNAAPALRQDRNGLAERHRQSMVSMARSWLASAELPASFGSMRCVMRRKSVIIFLIN
jgi:hypothetical protein